MTQRRNTPTTRVQRVLHAAVLLAGMAPGLAAADDDAITPYRPSVSSPAQLPAAGQLELELGGIHLRAGDARRTGLPYQLKLAFNADWGVLLGGEAQVWQYDGVDHVRGVGDTSVTLKRAFVVDEASAFGIEFGVKIPTAKDTIGSGKTDYTVNTIYSRDLGVVHMDANLNATRLGLVDAGTTRTQFGLSASFSTPLSAQWGLTGELSGTHRGGVDNALQVLAALAYSPTNRLTFDIGVARSPRPSPASTSVFAGVVVPITKLW